MSPKLVTFLVISADIQQNEQYELVQVTMITVYNLPHCRKIKKVLVTGPADYQIVFFRFIYICIQ